MFHVDISKNLNVGTKPLSITHRFIRISLDDALVRKHRACMHVDANETSVASCAQRECGMRVITQNIKPNRHAHGFADRPTAGGHRGVRLRSDTSFRERDMAEMVDTEREI